MQGLGEKNAQELACGVIKVDVRMHAFRLEENDVVDKSRHSRVLCRRQVHRLAVDHAHGLPRVPVARDAAIDAASVQIVLLSSFVFWLALDEDFSQIACVRLEPCK